MLVNVELGVSGHISRLKTPLLQFNSNGTTKTKLEIVPFLYLDDFVKLNVRIACRVSLSLCIYSLMSLSVFEQLKTHYHRGVTGSRRIGYNRIVSYRLLASIFIHCYRPQTKFPKVMFLHLSVSHFVHGGGLHPRGVGLHQGESASEVGSASKGGLHLGGACIQEGWADAPSDTMGYGQQAGAMHPTGMHSRLE